jgi:GNAT superfamily N-acetyltransferase
MPAEPVIRKAGPADAALLSALIREAFRDVAEWFRLNRENCPRHPSNCTVEWIATDFSRGAVYFILERQGLPVGCAALERADAEQCYLERLAVLPAHRRNGFGRALVAHLLAEARLWGAARVGIGIIAADAALRRWYRKLGFSEGETKTFAHLPFRVTFMRYDL